MRLHFSSVALAAFLTFPVTVSGQIPDKIKERVQAKADQTVDKTLDRAENKINCMVGDDECIQDAKKSGKKVVLTDEDGTPIKQGASKGSASAADESNVDPGARAWANFDFVPGARVLFAEDFTTDNVGDFPRRLQLKDGNMEVVDLEGKRVLRASEGNSASFAIPLPELLPQRFTVEFDYSGGADNSMLIHFGEETENAVTFDYEQGGTVGAIESIGKSSQEFDKQFFHARIMADGPHVKVYMNETRVANVPTLDLGRAKAIVFDLPSTGTKLITNIRVAAGGRKLYDALSESGRVATHGIYFATASSKLMPESTPTLNEIGDMLKSHGDLRLTIEGHTDNVGNAAANQTLSEQRAASVREYLAKTFSVDASRLQARGFGASRPSSPNDTPEGRQNNRRVELVKM